MCLRPGTCATTVPGHSAVCAAIAEIIASQSVPWPKATTTGAPSPGAARCDGRSPLTSRPDSFIVPPHAPVAQLDRASDFGSEGRRFESYRARNATRAGASNASAPAGHGAALSTMPYGRPTVFALALLVSAACERDRAPRYPTSGPYPQQQPPYGQPYPQQPPYGSYPQQPPYGSHPQQPPYGQPYPQQPPPYGQPAPQPAPQPTLLGTALTGFGVLLGQLPQIPAQLPPLPQWDASQPWPFPFPLPGQTQPPRSPRPLRLRRPRPHPLRLPRRHHPAAGLPSGPSSRTRC